MTITIDLKGLDIAGQGAVTDLEGKFKEGELGWPGNVKMTSEVNIALAKITLDVGKYNYRLMSVAPDQP